MTDTRDESFVAGTQPPVPEKENGYAAEAQEALGNKEIYYRRAEAILTVAGDLFAETHNKAMDPETPASVREIYSAAHAEITAACRGMGFAMAENEVGTSSSILNGNDTTLERKEQLLEYLDQVDPARPAHELLQLHRTDVGKTDYSETLRFSQGVNGVMDATHKLELQLFTAKHGDSRIHDLIAEVRPEVDFMDAYIDAAISRGDKLEADFSKFQQSKSAGTFAEYLGAKSYAQGDAGFN